jgi:hypothetical protein
MPLFFWIPAFAGMTSTGWGQVYFFDIGGCGAGAG